MTDVFLDTVGLIALWDQDDQWHSGAERAFLQLTRARMRPITTSFVLLECGNAAARRPYRRAVHQLRSDLLRLERLIRPTETDCDHAWNTYGSGDSVTAGIVDLVSFEVMRRLDVHVAFTNDRHFRAAGFEVLF